MANCGDWNIIRRLGEGGFGKVYLAEHNEIGKKCALKTIERHHDDEDDIKDNIQHEVKIMEKLSHPNILQILDFQPKARLYQEDGSYEKVYSIVMELADGGELFDFIAQTSPFSEETTRFYFHQMCEAFEHMHKNGISHRDLKPENIVLSSDFILKIADFGLASDKRENDSYKGSASYMAPEVRRGHKYSGKCVDIFAAGVILFVMATQRPPFRQASSKDINYADMMRNRPDRFWKRHSKMDKHGLIDSLSESFKELVSQLISCEPFERPSLAEIKESEWYNEPVPTYEEVFEEMSKRKEELDSGSIQEDQVVPDEEADPEIFDRRAVHRGVSVPIEKGVEIIERQCLQYNPELKSYTKFFSSSDLNSLWNTLALFVGKVSTEYGFSAKDYSVNFEVSNEADCLSVTVNIFETNENTYCIQAVRNEGDVFEFNGIYIKMKGFFGGHLNTSEPSNE